MRSEYSESMHCWLRSLCRGNYFKSIRQVAALYKLVDCYPKRKKFTLLYCKRILLCPDSSSCLWGDSPKIKCSHHWTI